LADRQAGVGAAEKGGAGAARAARNRRLGAGLGIINHDLFLSNAKVRKVIRRAIDGRPIDGA
jgi:hypothetical protein